MSYITKTHGMINISPDFTTVGSVPTFDTVKLEHRILPPVGVEDSGLFVPPTVVIGGISADAPEWVTQEAIMTDLAAIVASLPVETEFDGYIEGNGEEAGDIWRIYIVGRRPVVVTPTLVWPSLDAAAQ